MILVLARDYPQKLGASIPTSLQDERSCLILATSSLLLAPAGTPANLPLFSFPPKTPLDRFTDIHHKLLGE